MLADYLFIVGLSLVLGIGFVRAVRRRGRLRGLDRELRSTPAVVTMLSIAAAEGSRANSRCDSSGNRTWSSFRLVVERRRQTVYNI
jgi:hypothetical protein